MNCVIKQKNTTSRDDFGVLKSVYRDCIGSLWIESSSGPKLEMTKKFPKIDSIEIKAINLIGHPVRIFTSQTTASWSGLRYFCDLDLLEKDNKISECDFWQTISGEDGYVCDGYNIND